MSTKQSRGFTLVEVMIVVAIVGILASIAYPNYQEFLRSARRADAQAALVELSQFMERRYTASGSYGNATCSNVTLPFSSAPKDGNTTFYNLNLQSCNASDYTLRAVPTGAQSSDRCGTLTLASSGVKGAGGTNCWN